MITWLLVLFGMLLNAAAQVALKFAGQSPAGAAPTNPLSDPLRLAMDPWFLGGLVLYAISVLNWVVVLSRLDLSVAYPLMSLGYIVTLIAGALWFHEPITLTRVAGIAVIIAGVILITRPATPA